VKNWGCKKHSCRINSGRRSNRFYPGCAVEADLGRTTAGCWKASFGCLKPAHAGAICPKNIPAPAPAGDACANGRNKTCGLKSGDSSSANWTSAANWIGVNHFWMAALLQLKRGRLRRQNQEGKGHEVDGGGRRPGCSSGKPAGLGLAGGSDARGKHTGLHLRTAWWQRTSAKATAARSGRPGLRQRPVAQASSGQRHLAHQPTPERASQALAQRWAHTAPLPQPLENRTHLCLAGKLSSPVDTL
jgi:hypothetical protein